MTRVKRSVHARKKRRATLALTKGYRGEAHSGYKRASEKPLSYHFNELSDYTQKPYLFSFDVKQ